MYGGHVRGIVVERSMDVDMVRLPFIEIQLERDETRSGSITESRRECRAALSDRDVEFQYTYEPHFFP